jgi:prophage tail gpP-like protein
MADNTVQLIAGDKIYQGWSRISIDRSLETVSGAFELGVTDDIEGARLAASIAPQTQCRVTIGGENVITGYVDSTDLEYDAETHETVVAGRDAAGDLVDCSYYSGPRQFNKISYPALLDHLLNGFKISVTVDPSVDLSEGVFDVSIQPAESVWEAIDRYGRQMGVLVMSDGNGGLLVTQAGSAPANSRLKLGLNIKRATFKRDDSHRFSHYIVLGQTGTSNLLSIDGFPGWKGEAFDNGVKRYRPLVVMNEANTNGLALYRQRAIWESTVRYGHAWTGTYVVNSWRDARGKLWQPNAMVRVEDDFAGVAEDLLIVHVKFGLDEQEGTTAELRVTRREAFVPQPIPNAPPFDHAPSRFTPPPGISGGSG